VMQTRCRGFRTHDVVAHLETITADDFRLPQRPPLSRVALYQRCLGRPETTLDDERETVSTWNSATCALTGARLCAQAEKQEPRWMSLSSAVHRSIT
jgi:hypothetical protein